MMGGSVRHCQPLNDNPRNPYCKGVEGLLESYKTTLNNGKVFKLIFSSKLILQKLPVFSQNSSFFHRNYFVKNEIPLDVVN